jgi:hypothetical protein
MLEDNWKDIDKEVKRRAQKSSLQYQELLNKDFENDPSIPEEKKEQLRELVDKIEKHGSSEFFKGMQQQIIKALHKITKITSKMEDGPNHYRVLTLMAFCANSENFGEFMEKETQGELNKNEVHEMIHMMFAVLVHNITYHQNYEQVKKDVLREWRETGASIFGFIEMIVEAMNSQPKTDKPKHAWQSLNAMCAAQLGAGWKNIMCLIFGSSPRNTTDWLGPETGMQDDA